MIEYNNKLKTQAGITLVALIITIIILILLSAIVIININKNNFIELAMNGISNYTISQIDEEKTMNNLDIKIKDVVEQIEKVNIPINDRPTTEKPNPTEEPEPTTEPTPTEEPPIEVQSMKINLQEATYSGNTEILSITPDAAVLTMDSRMERILCMYR